MTLKRISRPVWQRVRAAVACGYDGHAVQAPAWALFWPFRHDRPRMVLCAAHAVARGYVAPTEPAARPFVLRRNAPQDVRARQVGED